MGGAASRHWRTVAAALRSDEQAAQRHRDLRVSGDPKLPAHEQFDRIVAAALQSPERVRFARDFALGLREVRRGRAGRHIHTMRARAIDDREGDGARDGADLCGAFRVQRERAEGQQLSLRRKGLAVQTLGARDHDRD